MRHRILPDLLPEKPPAFVPYIYSLGDMRNLLGVPDSHYSPLCPLVPYTMRVFRVRLYGTGLRLGEAIKLNIQDVDLDTAIITVRDTKFFKSRLVPIGGDLLENSSSIIERDNTQLNDSFPTLHSSAHGSERLSGMIMRTISFNGSGWRRVCCVSTTRDSSRVSTISAIRLLLPG